MVKVISLSDEAYEKLSRIKEDKSFSKLVLELLNEKQKTELEEEKNILKGAGILKDEKKEWEEIKKQIYKDRKGSRDRW